MKKLKIYLDTSVLNFVLSDNKDMRFRCWQQKT